MNRFTHAYIILQTRGRPESHIVILRPLTTVMITSPTIWNAYHVQHNLPTTGHYFARERNKIDSIADKTCAVIDLLASLLGSQPVYIALTDVSLQNINRQSVNSHLQGQIEAFDLRLRDAIYCRTKVEDLRTYSDLIWS